MTVGACGDAPGCTDRTPARGGRPLGGVGKEAKRGKEEDGTGRSSGRYLFETYYCNSQQYPLFVTALLVVIGICSALVAIFFISAKVTALPGPDPYPKSQSRSRLSVPIPDPNPSCQRLSQS
ncbi:hypothetical protein chiPu_0022444 [Chiloscyllium punctatum]|uniref:Uncharacterized protein n=1 Tax=Chiloscyllium punctatum TaxID=137246 RepID=A0A401REX1_CHIPU|nr:hypothetical protein [Chiloscyllium punctatum]